MSDTMQTLSPAQLRALVALGKDENAKVRADVLAKLREAGAVMQSSRDLTGEGRALVTIATMPAPAPQRDAAAVANLGGYLRDTLPADAPQGAAQAVGAALGSLGSDRDRVALLAFLAAPAGAAWLGQIKDEIVAANRPGRTYAQTAEALGLSVTAVNKAVSRRAARHADTGLDF